MKTSRFAMRLTIGAGILYGCAIPGLGAAQNTTPPATPSRNVTPPAPRPNQLPGPLDDFAGLTFTTEQQGKIDRIKQDAKVHIDAVVKDDKLGPDQKGAMLQGIQHMERNQIYKELTPTQQKQVRKRILARRSAVQKEQERNRLASPQ